MAIFVFFGVVFAWLQFSVLGVVLGIMCVGSWREAGYSSQYVTQNTFLSAFFISLQASLK